MCLKIPVSQHTMERILYYLIWVTYSKKKKKRRLADRIKIVLIFCCILKDQVQRCITSLSCCIILIEVLNSDVVLLWLHNKRLFWYLPIFNFNWHLKKSQDFFFFIFFEQPFLIEQNWKEDLDYFWFVFRFLGGGKEG